MRGKKETERGKEGLICAMGEGRASGGTVDPDRGGAFPWAGGVARSKKRGAPRPWVVRCAGRINRSGVAWNRTRGGLVFNRSNDGAEVPAAARRADAGATSRRRNNRSGKPPGFLQRTNQPERGCLGTELPGTGWCSIARTTERRCGGAKGRAGATPPATE
ncbi:MAG: hypothetical protein IPN19_04890, partial [Elusimicrobia bacterium]|nr:hypothetical protein [Elusimicrobiota bacterium]